MSFRIQAFYRLRSASGQLEGPIQSLMMEVSTMTVDPRERAQEIVTSSGGVVTAIECLSEPALFRRAEAARFLGMSRGAFYAAIARGDLPKQKLYSKASLERFNQARAKAA